MLGHMNMTWNMQLVYLQVWGLVPPICWKEILLMVMSTPMLILTVSDSNSMKKAVDKKNVEKFGTGFFTFVERLAISFHPVWLLQRVWLLSEVPLFEG